jgi:hypothetical protein
MIAYSLRLVLDDQAEAVTIFTKGLTKDGGINHAGKD